jgi:dienelactone hydrolase
VPEPSVSQPESERFEVASRGDLVPARLWRGAAAVGRRPLVLIVPPLGAGKDAGEVEALARAIAGEGWAAAAIDLPLQGERASAKLSARLAACAARPPGAGADRLLWEEFLRQAVHDLAATLAALARRGARADAGLACVAFAPATAAAEAWAACEPRVRTLLRAEPGAPARDLVGALHRALAAA